MHYENISNTFLSIERCKIKRRTQTLCPFHPHLFTLSPFLTFSLPAALLWQAGIILFTFTMFVACPDPPTEQHRDTTITLTEVETGITGTKLKVAVEDTTDEWTFTLTRNDSAVCTQTVYQKDTLITDNGLTPTTAYDYKAYWMDGLVRKDSSNVVTVTTGDTTSHHFIFEIDTLGEYGSYLKDVAIVNENDIWAVGKIVTDTASYNAAHWDGEEWALILISPAGLTNPISCIYAINEDDIWFGKIGLPVHWDGESFYKYTPTNSTHPGQPTINAIWGTSSSNIYFVGDNGSIVHYDGNTFTEMESGTDVDLIGISGSSDGEHVFAVGFSNPETLSIILEIEDNQCHTLYYYEGVLPTDGNMGSLLQGTDVLGDTAFFATTAGLWKYNYITGESVVLSEDIIHYLGNQGMVVQSFNDIGYFNGWSKFIHYNGLSWVVDKYITNYFDNHPSCYGMDFNNNTVVSVGFTSGGLHAYVARGYRME